MRTVARISTALATCAVTALMAAAPAVAATSHSAACATGWGTNAKQHGSGGTVPTPVQDVRAGQHSCFDRLVIDLGTGARPSWSAQYVRHIIAQGSGRVLSVKSAA